MGFLEILDGDEHHVGIIGRGDAAGLGANFYVPDYFMRGDVNDVYVVTIGIGLPKKLSALGGFTGGVAAKQSQQYECANGD